jgi:hypothetical protein
MAYSNINKPNEYFNSVLYTGNGSTQSITGVNFQPDLVWIKNRNSTNEHNLTDIVRGATKYLHSNLTQSETTAANSLTSFDSDGFSLGNNANFNTNTNTYVAWNWLAGGTGVSNTDGSITSTVSVNTTAGFSVVSWTGNSGTVGHGLGQKPACIIIKSRQTSNNWVVVHQGLGTMSGNVLVLNSTGAASGGGAGQVEPTANVFTITSGLAANDNNIGYVFAEKKGFSKFGSYTGNGSTDGTFVYTGFKPAFVIIKRTDSATGADWRIRDSVRTPYNDSYQTLYANLSDAESTASGNAIDFVSNGFKIRTTAAGINASGGTFIYMAFAENPLVAGNYVPTTAR